MQRPEKEQDAAKIETNPDEAAFNQVLTMVFQKIPRPDFDNLAQAVHALQRRSVKTKAMAPLIGKAVAEMWDTKVLPVIEKDNGAIRIPISTLRMIGIRLIISDTYQTQEDPDDPPIEEDFRGLSLEFTEEEQVNTRELSKNPLLPVDQAQNIYAYYHHDRYNLSEHPRLVNRLLTIGEKVSYEDGTEPAIKILPRDFEVIEDYIANFENIVALGRYPHEFLATVIQSKINSIVNAALDEIRTTKEVEDIFKEDKEFEDRTFARVRSALTQEIKEDEEIDILNQIALPIARLLRMRFAVHDYDLVTSQPGEANSNYIFIQAEETKPVRANFGVLCSIIYNLAKNSIKAIDSDMRKQAEYDTQALSNYPLHRRYGFGQTESGKTLTGYGIGIQVKTDTDEQHQITVSDNGIGINTDQIMQHAAAILRENPDSIPHLSTAFISQDTLNTLLGWTSGDDLAPRPLSLGAIWDLLGLPRLSGFNSSGLFDSSGMGLWGVAKLAEDNRGSFRVARRYNGGALFEVTLRAA